MTMTKAQRMQSRRFQVIGGCVLGFIVAIVCGVASLGILASIGVGITAALIVLAVVTFWKRTE